MEYSVAIVRQKVLAIILGTSGYGVWSVARPIYDLLTTLPLLGMDGSSVRFISSHAGDKDRSLVGRVVATTLGAALLLPPLVLAIYFFFSATHAREAGIDERFLGPFRLGLFSAPFMSIAAVFNAFLIGFKQIRRTVTLIVVNSLLSLFVGVPLIVAFSFVGFWNAWERLETLALQGAGAWQWFQTFQPISDDMIAFGLWGATSGLLVLGILNMALSGWFFSRLFPISLRGFSLSMARRMSAVASGNWMGGVFALVALIVIRSSITNTFSDDATGLYHAVFMICSQYLGPLAHTLIFYTYPRMSELREADDISSEIQGTVRMMLLLTTPAMALMGMAISPLLAILFTTRFLPAAPLLGFQMVGEWIRLPMRSMGMALLGQERVRWYIAFDLIFYLIWIAVTILAAQSLAFNSGGTLVTRSPCVGYALAALVGAIGYYMAVRRHFGFRLGAEMRRLIFLSVIVLMVSLFLEAGHVEGLLGVILNRPVSHAVAFGWMLGVKLAVLLVWTAVTIRRSEWAAILDFLKTLREKGQAFRKATRD